MAHTYVVMTPMMLDEEHHLFFERVNEVIGFLLKNKITTVDILFACMWDDGWEPFTANVPDIMDHIRRHEQKTGSRFGENDVYINLPRLETQIVFCHEADLHIEFNNSNPLVRDILAGWEIGGLLHCTQINGKNVEWNEMRNIVFGVGD